MQVEVEACLSSLSPTGERSVGPFAVLVGAHGFVCRTGIGRVSEAAADLAISELSPRYLLSVGTAGGLNAELKAGDLVLCDVVNAAPGSGESDVETGITADPRLIELALEASSKAALPVRTGGAVTVDSAASATDKRRLFDWRGHEVVEMENFWIARAASRACVPFLAIRAISDEVDDDLPQIPGLIRDDGTIDHEKLIEFTTAHPEVIPVLASQHERAGKALANLRTFLDAFVPALAGAG